MIDLHIHTTSSDGSDEPVAILAKAQQAGLKYISITDHDSIGAYQKLRDVNIKNHFDGRIIPGCEFTAKHDGKPIEVLGYGIDLDVICSTGVVSDEKFQERENQYLNRLIEVCDNLGLHHSKNLSVRNGKYFATQILHADLIKYAENEALLPGDVWKGVNAFYRNCVNNEKSPFFLDQISGFPTVTEIAQLIRQAGGKAFLAHLYGYYADNHSQFLDSMVELHALDGVETYHSLHSLEITRQLLDYCSKHSLYASGGSDYHGLLKPTVNIGESLDGVRIPFEILKPWLPTNLI